MNRGDRVRLTWADEPTIRTVVRAGNNGTYLLDDGRGGTVWAHATMIVAATAMHGRSQATRSGGEPTSSSLAPSRPTNAPGAVPLALGAHARNTDPATSHAAAASITPDARADRYRDVLAILAEGPADDFELARRTGLKQTSIGKRRGELRDAGLVVEHDRLGVSDTNSACIRWALTEAGRAAA